ncbi:MAG: hypothetical protein HY268_20870 [Deltaproteobacteria bacterium]|nr:hypothetical protein [Deltaproteobacteria bacterium]
MAIGQTNLPDNPEAGAAESQAGLSDENSVREERIQTTYRGHEQEWRRTHREILQTFAGEWVVLEGEKIVAHGGDPVQVVAEARTQGVKVPYLFYVEAADRDVVRIGL